MKVTRDTTKQIVNALVGFQVMKHSQFQQQEPTTFALITTMEKQFGLKTSMLLKKLNLQATFQTTEHMERFQLQQENTTLSAAGTLLQPAEQMLRKQQK